MDKIIELVNLQKSFGDHEVLRDINLSLSKGEVVSVIGSSGSGKSTMLRCINLLEEPTGGQILYNGTDITNKHFDLCSYRSKVCMVFQQFNLFNNMTALENCIRPQKIVLKRHRDEAKAIALENLEKVGMSAFINARPSQLSGGQKQRVAIAGVLAIRPKILILDEATSMLDPKGREEVNEVIRKLNKEENITVITVTHYMEEALNADRVIVTKEGEVAFSGTPEEVFEREKDIERCGLCLPRAVYIGNRLKEAGVIDANAKCYTAKDLEVLLCESFAKI